MTEKEIFELVRSNYAEANKDYIMEQIAEASKPWLKLSCPKCHGNGKNKKYIAIKGYSEYFKCKLCNGTGKIGVDGYERIQRLLREVT